MPRGVAIITAGCVLGLSGLSPLFAGVIYDSFQAGDQYSWVRGDFGKFGATYLIEAAAFTSPYICWLSGIEIALGHRFGPNEVIVSLYGDNGGVPGVKLEQWSLVDVVQPMVTHGSIIQLDSSARPMLGAGQYWVVVDVPDRAHTGMTWWHATWPPVPGRLRALSWGGGPWELSNHDMAFRVTADVPEPTTGAQLLLGFAVLLAGAHLRARQKSRAA